VDYERLEFYGDAIISFLVIIEIYLVLDPKFDEGKLDIERVKRVSNKRFKTVNEQNGFYHYMITQPENIFGLTPAGFQDQEFHEKVKQKQLQEFMAKKFYL